MPLKDTKFKHNQTILKVYGFGENKKIKVITFDTLRTSGLEIEEECSSVRGTVNFEKLRESIVRSKNKIFELAFCNPWDFFFTGTLDPKKYDRTDLEKFHKDLTKWIYNQGQKLGCKIDFLLVPELHSDGKSWHLHGFIKGLPFSELKKFEIGDKMSKALAEKVKNGDLVFNWEAYQKKFGFCDLEKIKNHEAVSKYVTKYINKNLALDIKDLNAHVFYHSRGLKTAQIVKKGTMLVDIAPNYSSEYCKVAWLDYSDTLLENLQSSIIRT